ncbi:MAG: arsenate reductase (glutaredoxin) [Myxococcota bacterium]
MSGVTIWHNPKCSKSRQTLALLEERGVEPTVVKYLQDPPSAREIDRVLKLLDVQPRDLMRKKEAPYAELGLAESERTREELIRAMAEHPILIERPVVIRDNRARIGRPPERVLEIL